MILGLVGLMGWLVALSAVRRRWHERGTVTTLFALGMGVLIVTAGFSGGAYEQVVPLWLGLTLLFIPALPGVTALIAVWQRPDR